MLWIDYIFYQSKILQNSDHHNAFKPHSYRHELQQAKGIVTDRCPLQKLALQHKGNTNTQK